VALLLLSLIPTVASADDAPAPSKGAQAKARYGEGASLFKAMDYAGAATAFREAYALFPDPAFLFDIAQAYRLGGECGNAVPFYRAFLSIAPGKAPHRGAAMSGLRACASPEPEVSPEMPAAGSVVQDDIPTLRTDDGSPGVRIAGLSVAGAGLVAAGAAAYFGWRAHDASDDIEGTLSRNGGVWTQALQERHDESQADDKRAIGLTIGGAAAMLSGSLLWYLGRSRGAELVVTPHDDGATLSWTGSF
jgi:hypothetical protein